MCLLECSSSFQQLLKAVPAGIEVDDALSISEQVSSGTGIAAPRPVSYDYPEPMMARCAPISVICQAEYKGALGAGSRHSFSYRRLIKT